MKELPWSRSAFPSPLENGDFTLPFTRQALIRAVVAAGKKPGRPASSAARDSIQMRIKALCAALDMSQRELLATTVFLAEGSTIKAQMSFHVGNALCAHAAHQYYRIPWLIDIETAPPQVALTHLKGKKRPDFIGRTSADRWYVFESKGRSSKLSAKELGAAKRQARSVPAVQGTPVSRNIVSAAYLQADRWRLLWSDPTPDDGASGWDISDADFFQAYYGELVELLGQNERCFFPDQDVVVSLDAYVLEAYRNRAWNRIRGYADRFYQQVEGRPLAADLEIFADGIAVWTMSSWANATLRLPGSTTTTDQPMTQDPDMSSGGPIGKSERTTQDRIIQLFREQLGYTFMGDWSDFDNRPVNETLLRRFLTRQGRTPAQIARALDLLGREVGNPTRSLYDTNQAVYGLLRYGVSVKIGVENSETIWLIDWQNPTNNDFALAEEVTLKGAHERRPDLVLYVNGLAIGVIELKRSAVSVGEGIRQLISNQRPDFHAWFFATVHLLLAGNDSQGLRYGTTGTPETFYLTWKEDEADASGYRLDKHLRQLCAKERLIELLRDFVLYDGGVKKLPRPHQYFGIKAAQARVQARQGGIIWHTQGSGKSIVMVLLARWILEHRPQARVVIVTDRDELDKQIEGVFTASGETIARSSSGADLMAQLGQAAPRLLCSLVHKFGKKGVADFDAFIRELKSQPSRAVGELFVFVDECHRTQSGRLHQTMKALLPEGTVFIGFTGTPLLKEDRQTSQEIFGTYIHTYKFGEAVEDHVVLDLVYEARDISQELTAQDKVDQWFEAKTKGLNDWQKAALREQWGTMQRVLSSRSRIERVVADIVFDFGTKPRLISRRGTAMLVASSIYEACRYYDLFQKTGLAGHCAIVTSYNPQASDITTEDTGAETDTEKEFVYQLYTGLLAGVQPRPNKTRTETYEDDAKSRFIKQPGQMRLLIVVQKLLTGFDAPSCTYLYIDKTMADHGLFQAICRTNRLDGDDKPVGCIVDYKDLFTKVKGAIEVYTKELDTSAGGTSPEVLMQNRLEDGRKRLDSAREALALLCEPVAPPKGELEFIRHFCGNPEIPADLITHEPERIALYQTVAGLLRAYATIAGELASAGYTQAQVAAIEQDKERAVALRNLIRQASGETLDMKPYEADMRHLIDTYISAAEARAISDFGGLGLVDLLVKSGLGAALASLPAATRGDERAVAETIANNVRSTIIKKHLLDPAYYDRMSTLLTEVLADLKAKRIEYQEFLRRIAALAKQVQEGQTDATPEPLKKNPGMRAIYNALLAMRAASPTDVYPGATDPVLDLAQRLDVSLRHNAPNGWRGVLAKEREVQRLIYETVGDPALVERLFLVITAQKDY
jgi:type I restriction enzyme, R subunit